MTEKTTKIKIDFFKVDVGDTCNHLEKIIEHVNNSKDDESRSLKLGKFAIARLQKASLDGVFYRGDMVRIKMDDVPIKASGHHGKTEPILLKDDEGIGVECAFSYHIPSGILLLQRTNSGVTHDNFKRYFQELGVQPCVVNLKPIANSDVILQIEKMKTIKRLKLSCAKIDNKSVSSRTNPSVAAALELNEYLDAPNVEIIMSVGRSRHDELKKPSVLESIKEFVANFGQHALIKGQVNGIDDEDEKEIINLSGIVMRTEIEVSYTSRSMNYNIREKSLITAWEKKKNDLKEMYPKAN